MHIYLVQHGQALSDEQDPRRPLSLEGHTATTAVARYLANRAATLIDPPISEIRHSGKLRAKETAEIFATQLCPDLAPITGQSMKPMDDPQILYCELAANPDRPGAIMLVGHLPHLAHLVGLFLANNAKRTPVRFTNAAVLKISPANKAWAVDWYMTPECVQ